MIITYKVKHGRDFSEELRKAIQVAKFAITNKDNLSSKNVRAIGLKSTIASQILWKYGRNRRCKKVSSVNLIVPAQGVKLKGNVLKISSLKLELLFAKSCIKVNQVELDKEYAFISVTVAEKPEIKTKVTIGIDRNATGHIVVASCPETGKVWKLGKSARHIHNKYKNIRKDLQSKGKFKKLKSIQHRETQKIRDLNHKVSRKLVDLASGLKGRLVLENLEGIRKAKSNRAFRYTLNSWSFYQLQTFLEYKAKLAGIPISFIDPYHTSKCCSRCGLVGVRIDKKFTCPACGNVEHADTNASFNIALVHKGVFRFAKERDLAKGSLTPRKKLRRKTTVSLKPTVGMPEDFKS